MAGAVATAILLVSPAFDGEGGDRPWIVPLIIAALALFSMIWRKARP
jgi:hypothetical protein